MVNGPTRKLATCTGCEEPPVRTASYARNLAGPMPLLTSQTSAESLRAPTEVTIGEPEPGPHTLAVAPARRNVPRCPW